MRDVGLPELFLKIVMPRRRSLHLLVYAAGRSILAEDAFPTHFTSLVGRNESSLPLQAGHVPRSDRPRHSLNIL